MTRVVLVAAATAMLVALIVPHLQPRDVVIILLFGGLLAVVAPWVRER